MSRSVMIRGAGDSSSKTRAAPVPFSVILVAVSRSVWLGPTARTTLDIPSRTSTAPPHSRSLVSFDARLTHAWAWVGESAPTDRIPAPSGAIEGQGTGDLGDRHHRRGNGRRQPDRLRPGPQGQPRQGPAALHA